MLLSRFASFSFKTFLRRTTNRGAAEGWERDREREIEVGVTVALPLHLHSGSAGTPSPPCDTPSIGDSSVWCAAFVLYCYW